MIRYFLITNLLFLSLVKAGKRKCYRNRRFSINIFLARLRHNRYNLKEREKGLGIVNRVLIKKWKI